MRRRREVVEDWATGIVIGLMLIAGLAGVIVGGAQHAEDDRRAREACFHRGGRIEHVHDARAARAWVCLEPSERVEDDEPPPFEPLDGEKASLEIVVKPW